MTDKRMTARAWLGLGASIFLVAGLVLIIVGTRPSQEPPGPASAATTGPITAADPSTSPAPIDFPEVSGLAPGDLIATIAGDTVGIYDAAGDATPRESLSRFSYYGNVRTFLGLETKDIDGVKWIHAQLPEYPNNSTGWIKADEVTVSSTDMLINVYIDEHEVDLLSDGEVELTSTAVMGADASPTPLGTYFVADPVDFTSNPTGTYGAFALGLSAYSETLETFKGALPQIALHGTNSDKYFGQSISNGCIRLPDDAIRELAVKVTLGTPVVIHQHR